jgi:hypothetical protein
VHKTCKLLCVFQKQQLGCVVEEEPQDKQFLDKLMAPEDEPVLTQFQRSMSLPRGFGKREQLGYQQQQAVPPLPPVRVPSPRSDSVSVLRNLLINRHRVRVSCCHAVDRHNGLHLDPVFILFGQCILSKAKLKLPQIALLPL